METAVEHWQDLLATRARQMDAAYARLGRTSRDFWDRRARSFHSATKDTTRNDPFYLKVRGVITPEMTLLDVGAGTGRFALALAPQARQVIVVEPSASMLQYCRQDAQEQGISNVTFYQCSWQEAPADLRADIVICSHVLYPIRDIVPFLEKLNDAAIQGCYIYMRATQLDALTAPIWKHFHGEERYMSPGYIQALDVLYEMGIYANVEVVKQPSSLRYPSLDVAVTELQEQLILPDDARTREELRALLKDWLVERDGMLTPPGQEIVSAIMYWRSSSVSRE